MDEYERKLRSMQKYVPFLDKMISKLEREADRDKRPQLDKMKSLHAILTDTKKKLKLDVLLKCEQVLVKLYEKVEVGHKAEAGTTSQPPKGLSQETERSSHNKHPVVKDRHGHKGHKREGRDRHEHHEGHHSRERERHHHHPHPQPELGGRLFERDRDLRRERDFRERERDWESPDRGDHQFGPDRYSHSPLMNNFQRQYPNYDPDGPPGFGDQPPWGGNNGPPPVRPSWRGEGGPHWRNNGPPPLMGDRPPWADGPNFGPGGPHSFRGGRPPHRGRGGGNGNFAGRLPMPFDTNFRGGPRGPGPQGDGLLGPSPRGLGVLGPRHPGPDSVGPRGFGGRGGHRNQPWQRDHSPNSRGFNRDSERGPSWGPDRRERDRRPVSPPRREGPAIPFLDDKNLSDKPLFSGDGGEAKPTKSGFGGAGGSLLPKRPITFSQAEKDLMERQEREEEERKQRENGGGSGFGGFYSEKRTDEERFDKDSPRLKEKLFTPDSPSPPPSSHQSSVSETSNSSQERRDPRRREMSSSAADQTKWTELPKCLESPASPVGPESPSSTERPPVDESPASPTKPFKSASSNPGPDQPKVIPLEPSAADTPQSPGEDEGPSSPDFASTPASPPASPPAVSSMDDLEEQIIRLGGGMARKSPRVIPLERDANKPSAEASTLPSPGGSAASISASSVFSQYKARKKLLESKEPKIIPAERITSPEAVKGVRGSDKPAEGPLPRPIPATGPPFQLPKPKSLHPNQSGSGSPSSDSDKSKMLRLPPPHLRPGGQTQVPPSRVGPPLDSRNSPFHNMPPRNQNPHQRLFGNQRFQPRGPHDQMARPPCPPISPAHMNHNNHHRGPVFNNMRGPAPGMTYGEYRKYRQEQEALQKKFEEDAKRALEKPAKAEEERVKKEEYVEKREDKSERPAERANSMASFKIPKKKRDPRLEKREALKRQAEEKQKERVDAEQEQVGDKLPPDPPRTANRSMSVSSDSDSEQLKIDDSIDDEADGDSEVSELVPEAKVEGKECVEPDGSADPGEKKNDTKEMLKRIVAALEPEEASKLLNRANLLEKAEKLTLKQLKYLLAGDSDEEEEESEPSQEKQQTAEAPTPPSGSKRGRKRKKTLELTVQNDAPPVVNKKARGRRASSDPVTPTSTPTPSPAANKKVANKSPKVGTRRSRRLQEPEPIKEQETTNDMVADDAPEVDGPPSDDDSEDEDALVIDEGIKSPGIAESEKKEEKTEQEEVTKPPPVKKRRGRPPGKKSGAQAKAAPLHHVVPAEKDSDDENLLIDLGPPNGVDPIKSEEEVPEIEEIPAKRARKGRMAPKSKTWFPGVRDAPSSSGKRKNFASPTPNEEPVIKKEPKEPDPSVFFGTVEVNMPESFLNEPEVDKDLKQNIKQRFSGISSIFEKLRNAESVHEEKADVAETEKTTEAPKKETEFKLEPAVSAKSDNSSLQDMIERLKEKVSGVVPEESEDRKFRDEVPKLSLFKMVKNWKREEDEEALSAVLPTHSPAEVRRIHSVMSQGFRSKLVPKTRAAKEAQLSKDKIKHFFKCAAASCCFSSDIAEAFLSHLGDSHLTSESLDHLDCVYDAKKFKSETSLINHMISVHSKSNLQCPLCYFRTSSKLSLFVHQRHFHPRTPEKHGIIEVTAVENDPTPVGQFQIEPEFKCRLCHFSCLDRRQFSSHLFTHGDAACQRDFVCSRSRKVFENAQSALFHHFSTFPESNPSIYLRETRADENASKDSSEDTVSSEDDVDVLSEFEEEHTDVSDEEKKPEIAQGVLHVNDEDLGFAGADLYRCGAPGCQFRGEIISDFRDHVAICEASVGLFLTCFHCAKEFKHVSTLVEHLKSHGKKRYACSLCPYRAAMPLWTKNHLKVSHKVHVSKVMPVDPLKSHPDVDQFIAVPKNGLSRSLSTSTFLTSSASSSGRNNRNRDTFAPDEVDLIPKASMSRTLIRCSICDFSTKVRNNLVLHLKLHQRRKSDKSSAIPPITPVNPPTEKEEGAAALKKMMEIVDEEEQLRRPMSDEDMLKMPILVPDSVRFRCGVQDCSYLTIDSFMLQNHVEAIHSEVRQYLCPHCTVTQGEDVRVVFEDLEFHLRCHGDLLFKCPHCEYFHWQKRTAEAHVAQVHPLKKLIVRDVRKEVALKAQSALLPTEGPETAEKKGNEEHKYEPYKCGLCDFAEETVEGIRSHCSSVHEMAQQFKCGLCAYGTDSKPELEAHFSSTHPASASKKTNFSMIRIFYIDPSSTDSTLEERRLPLWSRNMPGSKHIRGILYDEEPPPVIPFKKSMSASGLTSVATASAAPSEKSVDEADNFELDCRECGISKKTVKSLKMHIKLLHLRTGKFLCKQCQYSANILGSINTHYKIQHPEFQGEPDFEERSSEEAKTFTHEFWKAEWGIPTLAERKQMVANGGDCRKFVNVC